MQIKKTLGHRAESLFAHGGCATKKQYIYIIAHGGENMQTYYNAKDLIKLTGCGRNKAYEVIKQLNRELEAQGYIVFSGRVPKIYADQRLYIGEEVQP